MSGRFRLGRIRTSRQAKKRLTCVDPGQFTAAVIARGGRICEIEAETTVGGVNGDREPGRRLCCIVRIAVRGYVAWRRSAGENGIVSCCLAFVSELPWTHWAVHVQLAWSHAIYVCVLVFYFIYSAFHSSSRRLTPFAAVDPLGSPCPTRLVTRYLRLCPRIL